MADPHAVHAEGLAKSFGGHRALDGVDLVVPSGSVCALLGPNGAGKTTAVRILATLTRPDAGRARILGHDVVRDASDVRSRIGLTGQYASLDEALTPTENLVVIGRLLGLRRGARQRAEDLLEEFGLTEAARRPVSGLSGGMRRRLDIAASLVARPPVIFLDEPTTGLDPRTRTQMWATVRDLVTQGSTVLLTTQYLEEADQLADRIAVVDRGRIVADDTPDRLKSSVGTSTLRVRVRVSELARAAALVSRVAGRLATMSTETGEVVVAAAGPGLSADVVVALREGGIVVEEVGVHRPSLDDVFFALTGGPHTADAEDEPNGEDQREGAA